VTNTMKSLFLHFTLCIEYQRFSGAVFLQGVYKWKNRQFVAPSI
jgi:hypothetical protein